MEEKDPLALERREAARASILGVEAGAAVVRARRGAGCVAGEEEEGKVAGEGGGGFELDVWRKREQTKALDWIFFRRSHLSFLFHFSIQIRTWEAKARR